MAKERMKPIVKFMLIFIGIAVLFGVFMKFKDKIMPEGRQIKSILGKAETSKAVKSGTPLAKIGVVTWGGYAGGQYYNGGFSASKESRYYKDYGILVEFKVLDDFTQSRNAWKNDEVQLLWATIDAFASESDALKEYQPVFLFQADWSRGGDAIVATNNIRSIRDLRGKKVAVAIGTPSHTFLLSMLQADDIEYRDIKANVTEVDSAITAAAYFKDGKVDAAVVWSPDDVDCLKSRPGSHILKSTKSATNIIADGFFAKKAYVDSHPEVIKAIYEGWMKGAAEINTNSQAKEDAIKILMQGLNVPDDFARTAINNVRLTTHGDNMNFFGLDANYKGVTGKDLYEKMARIYNAIGLAPDVVPAWRTVYDVSAIRAARLFGPEHEAEGGFSFTKATSQEASAQAVASKTLRITFATGSATLDQNAQLLIEMAFADTARQFAGSRIRIVGHTDSVGSPESNQTLSERRGQSVANYLTSKFGFDRNRFVVSGKGQYEPVADNGTDHGRALNRRTELQLL
ncbi:MAG: hypothetical protein A3J63_04670 [Candidatus Moranbacteria bacterium RIFCSPHIGHO2_02_FULL_40_12b]|nr:MAG: hypothetical protein A3J63_04670 [Candidatus Moranbacteria bacterium RIFCSPHIGHO2_02_FULL_40_12b]OGI24037.1 MAG: hypothetical protein A3E91_03470 [Candidatus Moranbacteria bacterium RIFCSPHIGHO2_12_FULL_40_10]